MYYFAYSSYFGIALFQWQADYGTIGSAVLALIATIVTVTGQMRTRRLESEIENQKTKQSSAEAVMRAWEQLHQDRGDEMKDVRLRLSESERHNRICERGQLKLVMQLMKHGVEIDIESLWEELQHVTNDIHVTKEKPVKTTP